MNKIDITGPYPKKKNAFKSNIAIENLESERKNNKAENLNFLNEQTQMYKEICIKAWTAISKKHDPNLNLFVVLLPYYDINPHEITCYFNCDQPLPYNSQKMTFDEENKCFTSILEGLPEGINYSFNFKSTWYLDENDPDKTLTEYVISESGIRARLIKVGNRNIKDTNIVYFPERKGKVGEEYQILVNMVNTTTIGHVDIKNVKLPNCYSGWRNFKGSLSEKIEDNSYNVIRPRIKLVYLENILVEEQLPPMIQIRSLEVYAKNITKEGKSWSSKIDFNQEKVLQGEIFLNKPIDIKKHLNDAWKKNEDLQVQVCNEKDGIYVIEPKSVYGRLVSVSLPVEKAYDVEVSEDVIFYAEAELKVIGTIEIQLGLELGKKGDESSFYTYADGLVLAQADRNKTIKSEEDYFKYIVNSEKESIITIE